MPTEILSKEMGQLADTPTLSIRQLLCSDFGDDTTGDAIKSLQLRSSDRMVLMSAVSTLIAVPLMAGTLYATSSIVAFTASCVAILFFSVLRLLDITHRKRTNYVQHQIGRAHV